MAFTLVLVHFIVLATARAVVNVKDSYSYSYAVNDETTGDFKTHQETRTGGLVRGSYSVREPGGILRTVEYTADPVRGFRAVVHRRALPSENATSTSTSLERTTTSQTRTPSPKGLLLKLERSSLTFGGSRSSLQRTPSSLQRSQSTSERSPSTYDRLPSMLQRPMTTSERTPSTTEKSLPTTQSSPSTLASTSTQSPLRTETLLSMFKRLPSTLEGTQPSTSEGLPSTSKSLLMSTYAPDNLGHFAAAMFGTRRKKLYRRQQQ